VLERHDGLLFYPVQTEGMEQSPNIVYTGAAPNQQILPAVRWAFGFLRDKRFFLVGNDSVHSWAASAMIRDEVEALGGEIVGEEYLSQISDVGEVIRKIARSRPDLIFNTLAGDINVFYSRALRAAGLTPDRTPSLYFGVSEVELVSFSPAENVGDYAAWNYFQSLSRAENETFVHRFRSRYGPRRVVADPMEAAYVGVHLWAQAVEAAGSEDPGAVRAALSDRRLEAPEGPVWVDRETQYTWKTMRLGRIVEGGQFEIIWSSGQPIRPEPFPSSRSQADWQAFLDGLFRRWNGHWTGRAR
jgi:urea transport system substrate-binding protein